MELRQLKYFAAVVEEGGFTRAATRLHVAQPGISAQIRQLERELGQQLLDRSGGRATPTAVGEAVLPFARAALAAVEGVRRTADEFAGLLRGRVVVGVVSGAIGEGFDIAPVLAGFHAAHPHVEIAMTEDTSERMLAALRGGGGLDLAVVGTSAPGAPPTGVGLRTIVDVPLCAAVPDGHPLLEPPGRTELPLADLEGLPLVSLPRGTGIRAALEHACAAAGFRPRIAFEASAPAQVARLAAGGLGVAVVPEPGAGAGPAGPGTETGAVAGLRMLRLTRPALRGRVAVAWPANGPATPAARALLARLCAAFPEAGA
ncbi:MULTISPECIES: LysR family transcriptional regulator [Streptomyces]|uniref:LysR family transcriptional regulator n=1 Tax=Streptomyces TaxID=1883 RepID=UPI00167B8227|nr:MULTISPECIES: LysR family transcriptional regulator [Streptomyces]MBD3575701.1 LysR family transcriptional regulator [Streptomyces sp. KD18]GGT25438.1 LysR family transcriptional regulator [Streptomyces toxytricini]